VRRLEEEFSASERHACELIEVPRSTHRYQSRRDDSALRERLIALAREKPRFGYRRLHVLLRRDGLYVNRKRVHRVYRLAGLQVKRIRRRRLIRSATPHSILSAANQEWAVDFANDVIASGRRIRVLSVIDASLGNAWHWKLTPVFPAGDCGAYWKRLSRCAAVL